MALSNSMSMVVSVILAIGVFSGMRFYRHQLAATGPLTILGGGLGAIIFLFTLTAIGNLELMLFGQGYQTGLIPEVVSCLLFALFSAGMVHGVSLTTCFIFSAITLYYMNRISSKTYGSGSIENNKSAPVHTGKRK